MTAIAARAYAPGVAYRFSRGGVEFSGKGPEEFAGVVRARFTLSAEGRKIADAVKTALNASVVLYDDEKHEHQVARADDRWLSIQTAATDEPRFCTVTSKINDRWTERRSAGAFFFAPAARPAGGGGVSVWAEPADK